MNNMSPFKLSKIYLSLIFLIGLLVICVSIPSKGDIATLFGWGTSLPSSCSEPQLFLDTDATSGNRIYACENGLFVLQGADGPGSSVDGRLALFDGTTGYSLKQGGCSEDGSGNLNCATVSTTDKTTAPGNRTYILENDSAITPDPTCADSGIADGFTLLDSNEADATYQWDVCSNQTLLWRFPATSITSTHALFSNGTAGQSAFRAIATGDLPGEVTLDSEWNTIGEVETIWSVNALVETEIDASSELTLLMDDETGTGVLVFSADPALTGNPTAPTASADDNDTSISTTAFVQGEINGAGGTSITCSSGLCSADTEIITGQCDFNIEAPVTGDDGVFQCYLPTAATIVKVYCNTTVDTSVINLYERTEASPNSGISELLSSDLTCDADGAATTDFSDANMAADSLLAISLQTTFTTGVVRIHIEYTVVD